MKKNTHPNYRQVLFVDSSAGYKFLCGSTLHTEATEKFEGKEYPVCYVSVSSASHPFYTGSKQLMDTEGRVDKFKKRYNKPAVQEKSEDEASEQQEPKKEAKADSKPKQKKAK